MPRQGHIHLSRTLGGAPENAPNMKWVTYDREVAPNAFITINYSLKGTTQVSVLKEAGETVRKHQYSYRIRVRDSEDGLTLAQDYIDDLEAMIGQTCYLCDHFHANDGADHAADVLQVVMTQMAAPRHLSPQLNLFEVEVMLSTL